MHESAGMSTASLPPVAANGHHGNGHAARTLPERQPMHVELNFCPPNSDPFDTVEWEHRTAHIKDENGKVLFEQTDCEIPEDLDAARHQRRRQQVLLRRARHARTRDERPAGDPPRRPHDRRLGHRRTATSPAAKTARTSTASWPGCACISTARSIRPVWFNVGLYHQYGVKGSPGNYHWDPETQHDPAAGNALRVSARLGLLHPVGRRQHGRHHAPRRPARPCCSSSARAPAPTCRRSAARKEKLSGGGTPSGPLSFMRVYDQIAAVVKSGGKTRRAAKMQSLKDWHPDILEFIECKAKEEKKARTLIDSGEYDANFNGEAYSSIMFQNANLSVRVSDEFMQAVEDGEKWTDALGHRSRPAPARPTRPSTCCGRWPKGPGSAAIPACSTTRRSTGGTPARTRADQRVEPVLGVHVPRRHGLQPVEPQPQEVPADRTARSTSNAIRQALPIFITAQEILVDHASYPTPTIAENSHCSVRWAWATPTSAAC